MGAAVHRLSQRRDRRAAGVAARRRKGFVPEPAPSLRRQVTALAFRLAWVGAGLCGCGAAGGCAGPADYWVKTNVPWPDEWAAGPREPYSRRLPVSAETIHWHRAEDMRALVGDLQRRLVDRPAVFGFVRTDFARRRRETDRPDAKALPVVEVRVVPRWLVDGHKTMRSSIVLADELEENVNLIAALLGRKVAWPPDAGADRKATVPHAGKDPTALLGMLLENDLFIRCETPAPKVFRSLEYRGRSEFLEAVDQFIAAASVRPKARPLEVLGLTDWTLDYVNRVCGGLEAAPFELPGKRLGLLSPDDLNGPALTQIKAYLRSTLAYHDQ